jgi:Fic-DOC domain mobile mystery protein B
MSDLLFDKDDSGTPLTPEEREGLIPSYITLQRELNEAEQLNIGAAERWAFSRKRGVLDDRFLRQLHWRMFKDVWRWAGEYRTTARNIGIDAWQISAQLHQLVDDTRYWIDHETYPTDDIAVRFHHKLVWIHPFANGNGRHARLAADLLLVQLGCKRFTWGRGNLVSVGQLRADYVGALQAADHHDYEPLKAFVRS